VQSRDGGGSDSHNTSVKDVYNVKQCTHYLMWPEYKGVCDSPKAWLECGVTCKWCAWDVLWGVWPCCCVHAHGLW
jgi:hypothetical protein